MTVNLYCAKPKRVEEWRPGVVALPRGCRQGLKTRGRSRREQRAISYTALPSASGTQPGGQSSRGIASMTRTLHLLTTQTSRSNRYAK